MVFNLLLPLVCFFFAAPSLTSTSANCSATKIKACCMNIFNLMPRTPFCFGHHHERGIHPGLICKSTIHRLGVCEAYWSGIFFKWIFFFTIQNPPLNLALTFKWQLSDLFCRVSGKKKTGIGGLSVIGTPSRSKFFIAFCFDLLCRYYMYIQ